MALEIVVLDFFGINFPVEINLGITSLIFVLATKFLIGRPIFFARRPAQIFPKFPLGTEKVIEFDLLFKFLYAKK